MDRLARCVALGLAWLSLGLVQLPPASASPPQSKAAGAEVDRSPVDLLLTPDEQWLLTANQNSNSVSLVRVADGVVVDEIPCGSRPSALALTPDGNRVLVSCTGSGELLVLALQNEKLESVGVLRLDDEPLGVAVTPAGHRAYVALTKANRSSRGRPRRPGRAIAHSGRPLAPLPGLVARRHAAGRGHQRQRRSLGDRHSRRKTAVRNQVRGPESGTHADVRRWQIRLRPVDGLCRPPHHVGQHSRRLGTRQPVGPRAPRRPGAARRWRSTRAARPWAIRMGWPSARMSNGSHCRFPAPTN